MTFSLAARCLRTGQFAAAVTSSSPAVAARCAFARAGVGAATTQNITDPRLGPLALDFLARGMSAAEACAATMAQAPYPDYRQITLIGSSGQGAQHSGQKTLGLHAWAPGADCVSAGNLLANTNVPAAVVRAFEATSQADELGTRVIAALQAGLEAGGEAGPLKSAGLILTGDAAWPIADLRVDWHEAPLAELASLWALWQPQMQDYVTRALNPASAPAYGVPGDL
ncbi:hypothetical protein GCM10010909_17280 [Acidocella aquatica]|uniref:Fimbrial assembly protein FimA n=1 Tax=Acidocella aquatica TaxID=1922313 RepID=A0ABQ6A706_9PROT|nr:DUF1028 domain-containing protein [Acidocella aquatica]GLR67047.1 hypothetical protein GCM10010909_17280 [Acidocella aquatica]